MFVLLQPPSRPAAQPPSRPAAQPPSRPAAQPPSRPAAQPPSRRAAQPPSRPAAEPRITNERCTMTTKHPRTTVKQKRLIIENMYHSICKIGHAIFIYSLVWVCLMIIKCDGGCRIGTEHKEPAKYGYFHRQ